MQLQRLKTHQPTDVLLCFFYFPLPIQIIMQSYKHALCVTAAVVHLASVLFCRITGIIRVCLERRDHKPSTCRNALPYWATAWSGEDRPRFIWTVIGVDSLLVSASLTFAIPEWAWPAEVPSMYVILSWHMMFDVCPFLKTQTIPLTQIQGRLLVKVGSKVLTKFSPGLIMVILANLTCLIPLFMLKPTSSPIDLLRQLMITGFFVHRLATFSAFIHIYVWNRGQNIRDSNLPKLLHKLLIVYGGVSVIALGIAIAAWTKPQWIDVVSYCVPHKHTQWSTEIEFLLN